AQALGIGEAAYRVARDYAHSRKQFETPIENFPAVRELLVKMSVDLQAARALTYHSCYCVDREMGPAKKLEFGHVEDSGEKKALRKESRKWGRFNKILTPLSKYYASEMSMRVANDSIAVLGGSGYMKDYPVERHLRDSRITTIYEGTSQLQVVAAVAGVTSGTGKTIVEDLLDRDWPETLHPVIEQIREGLGLLDQAVEYVKAQSGRDYRDLYARKLVDIATYLIIGALFADQATTDDKEMAEKKHRVARYWMHWRLPEIRMNVEQITSGDLAAVEDFEALAGPVPVVE
ncbi:MAG: acyl-CoA dehydrogenase family protein, partial [Planctomycetota bacterium]